MLISVKLIPRILLLFSACEANGGIWIFCSCANAQTEWCYCIYVLVQNCNLEIFFFFESVSPETRSQLPKAESQNFSCQVKCLHSLVANRIYSQTDASPKYYTEHTQNKKNQKHINNSIIHTSKTDNNWTRMYGPTCDWIWKSHYQKQNMFLTCCASGTTGNTSGCLHILLVRLCNLLP